MRLSTLPEPANARLATTEDSSGIGSVHVAAWKESYRGLVPDAMLAALSVTQRKTLWLRLLSEPHGPSSTRVYVAPARSRIVGFSACGPQRSEQLNALGYDGEISAIYVLRSSKGRGLGRLLFQVAADGLRQMNYEATSLWVLRDNINARSFYEHLGGKLIGERQDVRDECILHEVAYGWGLI